MFDWKITNKFQLRNSIVNAQICIVQAYRGVGCDNFFNFSRLYRTDNPNTALKSTFRGGPPHLQSYERTTKIDPAALSDPPRDSDYQACVQMTKPQNVTRRTKGEEGKATSSGPQTIQGKGTHQRGGSQIPRSAVPAAKQLFIKWTEARLRRINRDNNPEKCDSEQK